MIFFRSNFRITLREWIEDREKLEKSWGYTFDSGHLAGIRKLYHETEFNESLIQLVDK